MVYGGDLWRYNPRTLVPEPDAAASWTISEDKLTYTFKLRDDLKWSDGQPLTSADYKFAFDQASNKVYVVNYYSGTATACEGAANSSTIQVGAIPSAAAVNSTTNKIYVTNEYSGKVTVVGK